MRLVLFATAAVIWSSSLALAADNSAPAINIVVAAASDLDQSLPPHHPKVAGLQINSPHARSDDPELEALRSYAKQVGVQVAPPVSDEDGKVTTPDVLMEAHTAPLGVTFYEGKQFPAEYNGSMFVALHGSWNRTARTGYKVVRLPMENGKPTGVEEDFMTGFVKSDAQVWGRPVAVAVGRDGALYVTDDAGNVVWRVAYEGK